MTNYGYTASGSTALTGGNDPVAFELAAFPENGSLDSISIDIGVSGNAMRVALYELSTTNDITSASLVEDLGEFTPGATGWTTVNSTSNPSLTSSAIYAIIVKYAAYTDAASSEGQGDYLTQDGWDFLNGQIAFSASTAFPSTIPGNNGRISNRTPSWYLTYTVTGPTLTDIDTDEAITDGQTSVAYTGTNLHGTNDVVRLNWGAYDIDQTTSPTDTTSGTFTVDMDDGTDAVPFTRDASATALTDASDVAYAVNATIFDGTTESAALTINIDPQSGTDVVSASAAVSQASTSVWQSTSFTPAKGDLVQFKTATEDDESNGYTGTVTIARDGTPTVDYGANPVPSTDSFLVRFFDASEPGWTADSSTANWATITLTDGVLGANVNGVVPATIGRMRRIKRWRRR